MNLTAGINQARRDSYSNYQQQAADRLATLEGDWAEQIATYIQSKVSPAHWLAIGHRLEIAEWQNVLADIINRTTRTYVEPARRRLVLRDPKPGETDDTGATADDITEDPLLGEILAGSNIDRYMDSALKRSLAVGLSMSRPWIDQRFRVRFQVLTPDVFEPITAYEDPAEIVGLTYTVFNNHTLSSRVGSYFIWDMEGLVIAQTLGVEIPTDPTKDERAEIQREYAGRVELKSSGSGDSDNVIETRIGFGPDGYPYRTAEGFPILPWATFTPDAPPDAPFNPNVGTDLQASGFAAAYIATRKAWLQVLQSHKQFVVSGPGVDKLTNQLLDPALPVVIPGDPGEIEISLLDLVTDPDTLQTAINDLVETLLLRRGWTLDDFVRSANRQTAEALEIRNEGRDEYDSHLATDVAEPAEMAFLNALRVVWNVDGDGRKLSENADFEVVFSRNTKQNILGNIDNVTKGLNLGIINIGRLVAEMDDSVETTEQGVTQAQENKKDLARSQGLGQSVSAVLDAQVPPVADETIIELDEEV